MLLPAMARRGRNELAGLSRIEARTEWIRALNRTVLALFCLGIGLLVVASAVPERRRLAEREKELQATLDREVEARRERDACEVQHQALREDSQFLETMARDRLDYCRPGERVLRIEREK